MNLIKRCFVAGLDTGVGKTFVACQYLHELQRQGLSTMALKPLASGAELTKHGLRNEDGLALQSAVTEKVPYETINPICYDEPVAPHIPAARLGEKLTVDRLLEASSPALQYSADALVVEGIGGWMMPLNEKETMADYAVALGLPIILVVGVRLGCLATSIATWQNIQRTKANVYGWVANCIDPHMPYVEENIAYLQGWFGMPPLNVFAFQESECVS